MDNIQRKTEVHYQHGSYCNIIAVLTSAILMADYKYKYCLIFFQGKHCMAILQRFPQMINSVLLC